MSIGLAGFARRVTSVVLLLGRTCRRQHLFELRICKDWVAVQWWSSWGTWTQNATLTCSAPSWPIAHAWCIGSTDRVTLAIALLSQRWWIILSCRAGPISDGVAATIGISNTAFTLIWHASTYSGKPHLATSTYRFIRATTTSGLSRWPSMTITLLGCHLLGLILLSRWGRRGPVDHSFCLLDCLLIAHELLVQVVRVAYWSRWIALSVVEGIPCGVISRCTFIHDLKSDCFLIL